jgi:hypothetical protein
VILFVPACGASKDDTAPLVGTLINEETVSVGPTTDRNVPLGQGAEYVVVFFPVGATSAPETIEIALSSGVEKQGATPANGVSVEVRTLGVTFARPVAMSVSVPVPPSGMVYRTAYAQAADPAWTIGGAASLVNAAPSADAGLPSGLLPSELEDTYAVTISGTGIWTVVLESESDAGQSSDAGADGTGD